LGVFADVRESLLCSHDFLDGKDVDYSVAVDDEGLVHRDVKLVIGLGIILGEGNVIDFGSFFWGKEKFDHHGDRSSKCVFVVFGFEEPDMYLIDET
jgi:hypothetical protein